MDCGCTYMIFLHVSHNLCTLFQAALLSRKLARLSTKVNIYHTYMFTGMTGEHGAILALSRIVIAEITRMNTFMRCLTIMGAFMQTALNTKKVTRRALGLAELHSGLQVHCGAFKCPAQVLNISVTSLEAGKVQGDPFANMFDAYFH
jgi:hypothetical protein